MRTGIGSHLHSLLHPSTPAGPPPSFTAALVCCIRAAEARRPTGDQILHDPHAQSFLGPVLHTVSQIGRLPAVATSLDRLLSGVCAYVAVRHRFIDEATANSPARRVVILGAGYDSRAWRLSPGARPVIEVDHPSTAGWKAARCPAPPPDRSVVTVDFTAQDLFERLAQAGHPAGVSTAFAWEGVSMYLDRETILSTLRGAAALGGPGSTLSMDFWHHPGDAATQLAVTMLSGLGEPLTFQLAPDDVPALLAEAGWAATEIVDGQTLIDRYGAPERPMLRGVVLVSARVA